MQTSIVSFFFFFNIILLFLAVLLVIAAGFLLLSQAGGHSLKCPGLSLHSLTCMTVDMVLFCRGSTKFPWQVHLFRLKMSCFKNKY